MTQSDIILRFFSFIPIVGSVLGLAFLIFWVSSPVQATINESMNFQGKLVNDDGTNVPDGYYNFEISVYGVAEGGTALDSTTYEFDGTVTSVGSSQITYSDPGAEDGTLRNGMVLWNINEDEYVIIEAVYPVTNTLLLDRDVTGDWNNGDSITTRANVVDGIFNLPVLIDDSAVSEFDTDSLYLEVGYDGNDNDSFEAGEMFRPRKRLSSVPYAFRAKYADVAAVSLDNYWQRNSGILSPATALDDIRLADGEQLQFGSGGLYFNYNSVTSALDLVLGSEDLNIDGDTLFVDGDEDRVGVGSEGLSDYRLSVSGPTIMSGGYERRLSLPNDQRLHTLLPTSDGGWIIGGYEDDRLWLHKTDANFDQEWSYDYGRRQARDIVEDSSGDYMVVGVYSSGGSNNDAAYLRVSSDGTSVPWMRRASNGMWYDYGNAIVKDGSDYVIVGDDEQGAGAYLVKFDSSGSVIYNRTVDYNSLGNNRCVIFDIEILPDGNYIGAGYERQHYVSPRTNHAHVVKVDSTNGNVLWARNILGGPVGSNSIVRSVFPLSGGDIIVTGETNTLGSGEVNIFISRLDSSGNIVWFKTLGTTNDEYSIQNAIVQASDGDLISVGYRGPSATRDALIIKFSQAGVIKYVKAYGGAGDDYLSDIEIKGNTIYMVGQSNFGGSDFDGIIVRCDQDGLCPQFSDYAVTESSYAITSTVISPVQSSFSWVSVSPSVTAVTPTDTILSDGVSLVTSGSVGIGDDTPDHLLDVEGNIGLASGGYINWGDIDGFSGYGFRDNGGSMEFRDSGGVWTDISAGIAGGSLWQLSGNVINAVNTGHDFAIGGTDSSAPFFFDTSEADLNVDSGTLFVDGSLGNVGIGDTSPSEELTVEGQAVVSDDTSAADSDGTLYLGRNGSAWEYLTWDDSDDRFEFSDDVWAESFVTGSGTLTITDDYINDSNSALNLRSSSGRVSLQADGITGNSFYIDSSSGAAEMYLGDGTTDAGIRVDGGNLQYRNESGLWTDLDSPGAEVDPVFSASPAGGITAGMISDWDTAYSWGDHALAGYLTSYTESDPIFGASVAAGIDATDVSNWDTAYSWGDHALAGYLTSYTESDPIFGASVAAGIDATDVGNWDTAYSWGDHALAGYLTSYTETDPIFGASVAAGIDATDVSNWDTAYSWGDHALAGYLTSYTETDPVFTASVAAGIDATDVSNWDTAYSWGDHALAGYLTSYTETDPVFTASPASGITTALINNWNDAYSWGDHALAGYLTSFSELDPRLPAAGTAGNLLRSNGSVWTSWAPNYATTSQLYGSWTLEALNGGGSSLGSSVITSLDVAQFQAGSNVTLGWSDDHITINSADQYSGTVTNIGTGTGLTGGPITTTGTISLDYSATLAGNPGLGINQTVFGSTGVIFEGSGADVNEGLLTVTNPTADRTWTLPDKSGTVALLDDITGSSYWSRSGSNTYLTNNGDNVGIGTSSPITQLHVPGRMPTSAVGSVSTGSFPMSLYIQGNYGYVVNRTAGTMQVVDVSSPSAPVVISTLSVYVNPEDVYVQGRYAYVVSDLGNAFQIVDVSNPTSPGITGSAAVVSPNSVYVSGRYAYVTGINNLTIFDISDPSSPSVVGSIACTSNPNDVHVRDRYAYVSNTNSSNLEIIDVSNPSSPVSVGSVSTPGVGISVFVQGRYAYVTRETFEALLIIDISNPTAPSIVNAVPIGFQSEDVYVQGRYAFLLDHWGYRLVVYDISNPASPVNVGSIGTNVSPYAVRVQGRYVYVVNYSSHTFQIFDFGGSYIQQLEAGGIETGTLSTRTNLQVGNDLDVKGGVVIGEGGLYSAGNLAITGDSDFTGNITTLGDITAATGTITASNFECTNCIDSGDLKVASPAGSASGSLNNSNPATISLNTSYSFFPSVTTSRSSGNMAPVYSGSDPGNTLGRFRLSAGESTWQNYWVRWNYVTASRAPEIYVVYDKSKDIIRHVWRAEIKESWNLPVEPGSDDENLIPIQMTVFDQNLSKYGDENCIPVDKILKEYRVVNYKKASEIDNGDPLVANPTNSDTVFISHPDIYYGQLEYCGQSCIDKWEDEYLDTTEYSSAVEMSDISEWYEAESNGNIPESGDVVEVSSSGLIVKSDSSYSSELLGIISTSPGSVLGNSSDADDVLIALNGRVPVKVSTENGAIEPGDQLTSSGQPGIAMKATKPGKIIGEALEEFNSEDPFEIGEVLVFVNLSWYEPENFVAGLSQMLSDYQNGALGGSGGGSVDGWTFEGSSITSSSNLAVSSLTATTGTFSILETQVLNVGGENFMVDMSGNVDIAGDLVVAGMIEGRYGDIVLRLNDTEGDSRFSLLNSDDEEVFGVNSKGGISLWDGDNSTTGFAVVKSGDDSVTIKTTQIVGRPKIYVTFNGDYAPATRYWVENIEGGESFDIRLNKEVSEDVELTWWIIGSPN